MRKWLSPLLAFLLGVVVTSAYLVNRSEFSSPSTNTDSSSHQQPNTTTAKYTDFDGTEDSEVTPTNQAQLIDTQAKEIKRLNAALLAVKDELNASLLAARNNQQVDKHSDEPEAQLKTMNMQTFEESMKTRFTDQFKGVVLQLEGQRLEDIKQSYNNSNQKNEWSNQYENSIANFLAAHDENGDHYLQSLNCNTNVCRLEVNTNDSDNWNRLYAKMTNEPWYKSITVQEKSEYPGNVIYYLPSLNN